MQINTCTHAHTHTQTQARTDTHTYTHIHTHLCIHSPGYLYSASWSPLLLRGAPDTERTPCRSLSPKRHRQLRLKDLLKVPTRRLERDSNPRSLERKATNLPMSHHASLICE